MKNILFEQYIRDLRLKSNLGLQEIARKLEMSSKYLALKNSWRLING
jgi:transcriptional regulator with XRE-family HTH domain